MSSEVRSGRGERRGLSPVHRPACTWQARAESAKPCHPLIASGLPVEAPAHPGESTVTLTVLGEGLQHQGVEKQHRLGKRPMSHRQKLVPFCHPFSDPDAQLLPMLQ